MSDRPVRRVSKFVQGAHWALLEDKLDVICELLSDRMHGVVLTADEVQARIGAGPVRGRDTTLMNAVAVVPLYGVLSHRMNMMAQISGGTSTTQFVDQVRQAVADPAVKAIVIDCDSPGGSVSGLREAAAALAELKGKGGKRIVAVANVCMASAAYWLLSQCDEIVATPSAIVGSIGVLAVHSDLSEANAKAGVKPTYITAGKYKAEANDDSPLSDEARANIQRQVDRTYGHFVKAVARGRGVSVATVESSYGQGRVFDAEDALAAKMVDSIATLEETISRLMGQPASTGVRSTLAAVDGPVLITAATPVPEDPNDTIEDEPMDECDPNSDGTCPDGYAMADNGMCRLVEQSDDEPMEAEHARTAAAEADALNIALMIGLHQ